MPMNLATDSGIQAAADSVERNGEPLAMSKSRARHTPGPWQLIVTDDGHEIRMGSATTNHGSYESQHIVEYDHGCILDDETDEDLSDPSPETRQYMEAEANARLIAAAPDLLAACEAMFTGELADEDEDDERAIDFDRFVAAFNAVRSRMREAIAKATGATQ
jgi:hypothetical protein